MPEPRILLVERGEEFGPFGAKSIGEVSAVPVVPAIMNALSHALGVRLLSAPATPEKIMAALEQD
jgi:CO/xanthine dehydrogenase Mo-binding subunit